MTPCYFCEQFKANSLTNLVAKINDYLKESDAVVVSHSLIKNAPEIELDDVPVYQYEALIMFARSGESEKKVEDAENAELKKKITSILKKHSSES